MIPLLLQLLFGLYLLKPATSQRTLPNPVICEDSLDGASRFDDRDVPCLLGCGVPVARPTGSLLPGAVNTTDIPYCRLRCVRDSPTAEQMAAAPDCNSRCENGNGATPENIGWCMFWCADGWGDLVTGTACVPSLTYGDWTTTIVGERTISLRPFTQPSEWAVWYQTQTVMPRTGPPNPVQPSSTATTTTNSISSQLGLPTTSSRQDGIVSSPTASVSTPNATAGVASESQPGQGSASPSGVNSGGQNPPASLWHIFEVGLAAICLLI